MSPSSIFGRSSVKRNRWVAKTEHEKCQRSSSFSDDSHLVIFTGLVLYTRRFTQSSRQRNNNIVPVPLYFRGTIHTAVWHIFQKHVLRLFLLVEFYFEQQKTTKLVVFLFLSCEFDNSRLANDCNFDFSWVF